jgi:hypothetical protein
MDCTIDAYWNDNNYINLYSFNNHWNLLNYQIYYLRIEEKNMYFILSSNYYEISDSPQLGQNFSGVSIKYPQNGQ